MIRPIPHELESGRGVLVWGALGFLGQHIVERLLQENVPVSVLCRASRSHPVPAWAAKVHWFEFREEDASSALLAAVRSASVIFDFAGLSGAAASNLDPVRSLDENCGTHLAFLRACEQAGHRPHVVFPSSWLVYDASNGRSVDETYPTAPRSIYGVHKLTVENYLRIYQRRDKISYTVCRVSNPYGFDPAKNSRNYKILNSFIQSALADRPICIFGDGRQLRDFIYIDDVIDALMLCGFAREARNEVFNISSGQSHSLLEAVEIVRDLVGAPQVLFKPWPEEYCAAEPGDCYADISKARSRLNFQPAWSLKAGLRAAISHYQQGGNFLVREAAR